MEGPLVSVIMPAYNAEMYIRKAVDSVIEQTYSNWELIITNDGSSDSTAEILNSYSEPRLKVFTQENKGVSAARNIALKQMKGKYFTFLDADDFLPPTSLQSRVNFAESNMSVDIIGGCVIFFSDNGIVKTWMPSFRGNPLQAFVRIDETAFCNPALFIRRKEGVIYRFKDGMSHVEDLLFFANVAQQREHIYDFIKEVVYQYRITNSSAMSNLNGLENGYWMFYDSVKSFPNQKRNTVYLKLKIIKIMLLSYVAAWKFIDAIKILPKLIIK